MSIVEDIAQAIARQEGPVPCGPNNNPGNLRAWGHLPNAGGFAVFPSCEDGWAALRQQVQRNVDRGLTLEEFFGGKTGVYPGYAPAADRNQPNIYAANVSTWTGIPLGVPLDQLGSPSGFEFLPSVEELDPALAIGLIAIGTVLVLYAIA